MLSFLWTVIIGFIAGVIAKLVTVASDYVNTILGVVGALVATYYYLVGQGPVSSVQSWAHILLVWGFVQRLRA